MIGALEKQKFVYVLNRDNEARLTISSPLEAHKSHHIVYDIVGMDTGFDNPQFAAIELDYGDVDVDPTGEAATEAEKQLVVYELDLGLNTVSRKHATAIDSGANMLVAVPGSDGGPGGVLVCAENFLLYRNPGIDSEEELRVVIPRRSDLPGDKSVLITAAATFRKKKNFYVFLQSEYGDVYKVTLEYEGTTVTELKMKYFDTIPPAISLCVLRQGFLFAASEFGDHSLYQFIGLGDDDAVESSSSQLQIVGGRGDKGENEEESDEDEDMEAGFLPVFFDPRHPAVNLEVIDRVESLAPILDMKVANLLGEEIPQIFTACGRGPLSTLRMLRPGLAVTEMASSVLPGVPTGIWTLRKSSTDEHDSYIVVSFTNNTTLILKVGDTVEQVNDTGLSATVGTLKVQHLSDDSLLQVSTTGMRHIRPDGRVNEWRAPGRRSVTRAATNARQAVIGLSGGEIIYFELSAQGMLVETEKRDLGSDIASIDVGAVPDGRQRCKFLAVGSYDNTVRVLSLDPGDGLRNLGTQTVNSVPESVLLLDSPSAGGGGGEGGGAGALFLQVGLADGTLLRTEVDEVTGQLNDTRSRFLGVRAPRLARVAVRGDPGMLALSSRPWLGYSDQGRYTQVPISCDQLDFAAPFASEQCPEGFVAVSKSMLRVLAVERLGDYFNAQQLRLRYTPRKMIIHPDYSVVLLAEADAQCVPLADRSAVPPPSSTSTAAAAMETDAQPSTTTTTDGGAGGGGVLVGPEGDEETASKEEQLGAPIGAPGQWASCLRVVDPSTLTTTHCLELDNNEAALSLALVTFECAPEAGALLCVGTAKGLKFHPREVDGGFLRVYKLTPDGKTLELVHSTPVEGIPRALTAYRGRLLVGMGNALRLYDLGKKRLLRKCEYRGLPCEVSTLHTMGPRIYVGDAQDSFVFAKYKKTENKFHVFADDTVPRHITAAIPLDYDTIAGGDRFGNVSVLRLPPEISAAVEEDPTAGKYAAEGGRLGGAPNRLQAICNFHVGESVTSLQRATMQAGGEEVMLYSTISGAIGALYPFSSRETVDSFQHLEMHMRQEAPPLLGRDHLAYRSAYVPVKDVIDGDLCGQFGRLAPEKMREVAEGMDKTPGEVLKMMEDVANKII